MSRKRVALMVLAGAAVALTAAAARPVAAEPTSTLVGGQADARRASLQHYLSAMSWPARMSVLRARSLTTAIDGFLSPGDPPYRRQVAARCRGLRAVAPARILFASTPPTRLKTTHRRFSRVFSAVQAGCKQARRKALRVALAGERYAGTRNAGDKAAYERANAAARKSLPRFARTTVRSFVRAVRTWRSAAVQYAAAVGVQSPRWLRELPLRPQRVGRSRNGGG